MTTSEWGRVAEDGTVYVRTADGERSVGQYPEGTPEEALAFFTKRYDELAGERRTCSSSGSRPASSPPTRPTESVRNLRDPGGRGPRGRRPDGPGRQARRPRPGDLAAARRRARAERAEKTAAAKAEKERLVAEAEKLGEGNDWRNGANRLRAAARRVEGAPPDRPGLRRRAVAAVLHRAHVVHPAPQGALRRAEREARRAPGWSSSGWSRRPSRSPAPREWGPTVVGATAT